MSGSHSSRPFHEHKSSPSSWQLKIRQARTAATASLSENALGVSGHLPLFFHCETMEVSETFTDPLMRQDEKRKTTIEQERRQ